MLLLFNLKVTPFSRVEGEIVPSPKLEKQIQERGNLRAFFAMCIALRTLIFASNEETEGASRKGPTISF